MNVSCRDTLPLYAFQLDLMSARMLHAGLKDTTVASDLAEGLLNNVERPPIFHPDTGAELFAGKPIPHFNEVSSVTVC